MKNVALPTKFHLLLRSILALTSAVAIASAACAETMAGDAAVGVSSPAVGMNQHGVTGTGYPPAMSGQDSLPTAQGAGIDLHQDGLTGWWFDPRTSRQGLFVQVYPDLLAPGKGIVQASWLTYDNVVGGAERQRWYTLSGTVASGQTQVALTIYQNTGGNFNAPPITTAQPIGTATLSFDSCTSGELTYNLMGRASTIALTRLLQNLTCSATPPVPNNLDPVSGLSGNWLNDATSGQGLAMEVNGISNVIFFAWMTYAPNGADAGPAGQRWYTGLGKYMGDSIPVQLYESTGGLFDQGEPVPTTVPVGSATLNFLNNCYLELSFNFTGGSSVGASGKIALGWPGAPPGGVGCWSY